MPRLPTHLTWSAFPAVADCAYRRAHAGPYVVGYGRMVVCDGNGGKPLGAVEGDAGDRSVKDQVNKMANGVDTNKRLRPVNVSSVRWFDGAGAVEPGF
jgi:hypothetical protein